MLRVTQDSLQEAIQSPLGTLNLALNTESLNDFREAISGVKKKDNVACSSTISHLFVSFLFV
jgi:hypothetical protein